MWFQKFGFSPLSYFPSIPLASLTSPPEIQVQRMPRLAAVRILQYPSRMPYGQYKPVILIEAVDISKTTGINPATQVVPLQYGIVARCVVVALQLKTNTKELRLAAKK